MEKECDICKQEIFYNDKMQLLNCNHIFHKKCVLKMNYNKSISKCAICRNHLDIPIINKFKLKEISLDYNDFNIIDKLFLLNKDNLNKEWFISGGYAVNLFSKYFKNESVRKQNTEFEFENIDDYSNIDIYSFSDYIDFYNNVINLSENSENLQRSEIISELHRENFDFDEYRYLYTQQNEIEDYDITEQYLPQNYTQLNDNTLDNRLDIQDNRLDNTGDEMEGYIPDNESTTNTIPNINYEDYDANNLIKYRKEISIHTYEQKITGESLNYLNKKISIPIDANTNHKNEIKINIWRLNDEYRNSEFKKILIEYFKKIDLSCCKIAIIVKLKNNKYTLTFYVHKDYNMETYKVISNKTKTLIRVLKYTRRGYLMEFFE
jgi:hypothetical protein